MITVRTAKSPNERIVARLLREQGLTDTQVASGVKYYQKLLSKFDKYQQHPEKAVAPIVRNIENMKAAYTCS